MKFKVSTKVFRVNNPLLYPKPFYVGLCGGLQNFTDVIDFFEDPESHPKGVKNSNLEGLILTDDKKLFLFFNPKKWMELGEDYHAIGSGMHFAMGAMAKGATPAEAVKVASALDPNTGMGVRTFTLK